jgi:hypothetical protein
MQRYDSSCPHSTHRRDLLQNYMSAHSHMLNGYFLASSVSINDVL